MNAEKKCKVEVKKDHISRIASGSIENALAELIWNALDADATKIEVFFHNDAISTHEIIIKDNGAGIKYEDAENLFVALGDSWKASIEKTPRGRFIHGKKGEGRFKAFVLGHNVSWKVIYRVNGEFKIYKIIGNVESIDEFRITPEQTIKGELSGVQVEINNIDKRSAHIFFGDVALQSLTPIFAPYLQNYPSINLKINGKEIVPREVIKNRTNYVINVSYNKIDYKINLDLIEWNGLKEKQLWFCNEEGFPIDKYHRQIRDIGDFSYTGYLRSSLFDILYNDGIISVSEMDSQLNDICEEAIRKIKTHFKIRLLENAKEQLDQWKTEKVYPYDKEPSNPIEEAERQVFDIIAINVNHSLPDFNRENSSELCSGVSVLHFL